MSEVRTGQRWRHEGQRGIGRGGGRLDGVAGGGAGN